MFTHVIIGTCLTLLGWGRAMDTFAGLPICDETGQYCTTSMLGDAVELPTAPGQCYLKAPLTDPYYDWLWCQPVHVGGIDVMTPCAGDIIAKADAPYAFRLHWAEAECPEWARGWLCELEDVCTPADELAELCEASP